MLLWYAALIKRLVAFFRKGVRVESDEGVLGAVLLERVVECEKAGEICCVGNKSCPYCTDISICSPDAPRQTSAVPFFDFTPAGSVVALEVTCMLLVCKSLESHANKLSRKMRSQ